MLRPRAFYESDGTNALLDSKFNRFHRLCIGDQQPKVKPEEKRQMAVSKIPVQG